MLKIGDKVRRNPKKESLDYLLKAIGEIVDIDEETERAQVR